MKLKLTLRKKNSALHYPLTTNGFLLNLASFHLPGTAAICFERPVAQCTRHKEPWQIEENLSALAISSYNVDSDGNSIGFIRHNDRFGDEVFEFNHELRYHGDDPTMWTKKLAGSLAEFIVNYLNKIN